MQALMQKRLVTLSYEASSRARIGSGTTKQTSTRKDLVSRPLSIIRSTNLFLVQLGRFQPTGNSSWEGRELGNDCPAKCGSPPNALVRLSASEAYNRHQLTMLKSAQEANAHVKYQRPIGRLCSGWSSKGSESANWTSGPIEESKTRSGASYDILRSFSSPVTRAVLHKPFRTVRSKIPSVARRADSGTIGKRSFMSPLTLDQS
jgi:hypothetical protein